MLLVTILSGTAAADIIVENQQVSYLGVTNQNQPLAKVVVGASDVAINGFGVYGQAQVNGNLKWVIFDSTSLAAPVYLSAAQAVTGTPGTFAANAQWYDSPEIAFTLLAGHTYAMGVMADKVGSSTFYWGSSYDSPFGAPPTVSGGGLSLPGMQSLCNSGLSGGSFVNTPYLYFINNSSRRQMSLRVSNDVPEPATLGLLVLGGGVALIRRRRRVA
jgi:hypothetical protein